MSMKLLAAEFGAAIAAETYYPVTGKGAEDGKTRYMPWPSFYVKTALGFSVLCMVELAVAGLGSLLGAGFMIAYFVKNYSKFQNGTIYYYPQMEGMDSVDSAVWKIGASVTPIFSTNGSQPASSTTTGPSVSGPGSSLGGTVNGAGAGGSGGISV
jgi:hypothetical protein